MANSHSSLQDLAGPPSTVSKTSTSSTADTVMTDVTEPSSAAMPSRSTALPLRPNSTNAQPTNWTPGEFDECLIVIELRSNPSLGLSDRPNMYTQLLPCTMIEDRFKQMGSKNIRACHVSLEKVNRYLVREFGFTVDFKECELEYILPAAPPQYRESYVRVTSELTFCNALCVLFNIHRRVMQFPMVTLYLWKPIPVEPVFPRSRRAAQASKPSPQTLPNPKPSSPAASPSPRVNTPNASNLPPRIRRGQPARLLRLRLPQTVPLAFLGSRFPSLSKIPMMEVKAKHLTQAGCFRIQPVLCRPCQIETTSIQMKNSKGP